jgi:hypothetical protein
LIDGRNFYNTCRTAFWETAKLTSLRALIIANYTPLPGESFTLSDILLPITTLDKLKLLKISNVALAPVPSRLPTPSSPRCLVRLELIDIHTFETFAEILGALGHIPELFVTRCAIGDPGIPFGGDLTLEDIGADQNLIPLLRRWEGEYLRIVNCPNFDDAVFLNMMVSNDAGNMSAARHLTSMSIEDCDEFSGASLRRLIDARRLLGHEITHVYIYGRAPEISAEDHEWLSQNLRRFHCESSSQSSSHASPSGSHSLI